MQGVEVAAKASCNKSFSAMQTSCVQIVWGQLDDQQGTEDVLHKPVIRKSFNEA